MRAVLLVAGGVLLASAVVKGWSNPFIGAYGVVYLWMCGSIFARRVFRLPLQASILLGPLTASLIIITIGTPLYFLSGLSDGAIAGIILTCTMCALIAQIFFPVLENTSKTIDSTLGHSSRALGIKWSFIVLGGFFFCASSALLISSQTVSPVLGPWNAVPDLFFVFLFLELTAWISYAIVFGRLATIAIIGSLVALQVGTLLAIVFPLGFGFDPFIHQAAERTIAHDDIITPKTLYYTGQYVLIVTLSTFVPLSIALIDRLALPFLVALSLPIITVKMLSTLLEKKTVSFVASVFVALFALLPLSASPTPWGFAVFLFLLLIISSIGADRAPDKASRLVLPTLLAVASFFIHPIAGIPALFILGVWILLAYNHRILAVLFGVVGAASVPSAFLINSILSSSFPLAFKSPFREIPFYLKDSPLPSLPWRFDAFLDPIYLVAVNAVILIILLSGFGAIVLWKQHAHKTCAFSVAASAMLFGNYLLVDRFFAFPTLVSYEQDAFGQRLLVLSAIALVPLLCIAIDAMLKRIFSDGTQSLIRSAAVFLLACAGTGAIYLTFPRNDSHASFHGFNVSAQDVAAVRWIHERAGANPYIVLSNQVVSAASIREFGFLRYYTAIIEGKKQILYTYPIPTSSPLYSFFLDMMKKPDEHIIADAMELAGVKRGFFVVNRYEPRGPNIMKTAQETTDAWKSFGDDAVMVFEYRQGAH